MTEQILFGRSRLASWRNFECDIFDVPANHLHNKNSCCPLWFFVSAISRRPGREKIARSLEHSSAGRSVKRAESPLKEIERFESE